MGHGEHHGKSQYRSCGASWTMGKVSIRLGEHHGMWGKVNIGLGVQWAVGKVNLGLGEHHGSWCRSIQVQGSIIGRGEGHYRSRKAS